ncbi:MAG: zinc ribbon domain-containing protein [Bacillota bacterium]|nr:zinc ribbon domain-containing protein [Candidatus Fermentithermobacillaceae bacterium]
MSKDLWSKIGQTIRTGAETLVQETKELTKVGRLKVELMSLENERGRRLEEVGRKAYALYRVGTAFPPELAESFAAVDETEKRIEEKNREIEALKAEAEAKEKAGAEKAAEEEAKAKAFCSQCGSELRPADVFCSQCGTKVQ